MSKSSAATNRESNSATNGALDDDVVPILNRAANDNNRSARRANGVAKSKRARTAPAVGSKSNGKRKQTSAAFKHRVINSKPLLLLRRAQLGGLAKWRSITSRIVRHRLFRYGVLLVMGFTVIWI
ncbi:hypothetical protein N9850_14535, partial [Granulosicoccus sp.]